jgi:hypothetical protein
MEKSSATIIFQLNIKIIRLKIEFNPRDISMEYFEDLCELVKLALV